MISNDDLIETIKICPLCASDIRHFDQMQIYKFYVCSNNENHFGIRSTPSAFSITCKKDDKTYFFYNAPGTHYIDVTNANLTFTRYDTQNDRNYLWLTLIKDISNFKSIIRKLSLL